MARSARSVKKEAYWRGLVDAQRQGGSAVRTFCRRKGISEPSFYAWRRELQQRDAERAGAAGNGPGGGDVRLIPVAVVPSAGEARPHVQEADRLLEIRTPSGFTLRFAGRTPPQTVARLLEVLAGGGEGGASC